MSLNSNLIASVSAASEKASLSGCLDLAKRHAALAALLRDFISAYKPGADDIDLLEALSFRFSAQCEQHLNEGSAKRQEKLKDGKSASNRHITNLRSILREEIKQGALPNLQVLPESADSQLVELKLKADDVRSDFKTVVAAYEKAVATIESPRLDSPQQLAMARVTERLLGMFLLSILVGGIGIDGLPELAASSISDDGIRIPGSQACVRVSTSVENILNRNLQRLSDLATFDAEDLTGRLDEIKANIARLLASLGIKHNGWLSHPRASWLQLALESGTTPAAVRAAIDAIYSPNASAIGITDSMPALATDISNWYAIKGIGKSNSGEAIAKTIASQQSFSQEADVVLSQQQMFAPQDILVRVLNGKKRRYNNPLIDKLLFIHCSLSDAKKVQKKIRDAGVILGTWTDNAKVYTPIPEKQLADFRRFLDHSEGEFITLDPTVQYKGKRVRIEGGQFAGCEGYIIDLKVASPTPDSPQKEKYVKCFTVILDRLQMLGSVEFDSRYVKEI